MSIPCMLLICRLCQQIDRKLFRRLAAFQIVFKLKKDNNETGKGKSKLRDKLWAELRFELYYWMIWHERVTVKSDKKRLWLKPCLSALKSVVTDGEKLIRKLERVWSAATWHSLIWHFLLKFKLFKYTKIIFYD